MPIDNAILGALTTADTTMHQGTIHMEVFYNYPYFYIPSNAPNPTKAISPLQHNDSDTVAACLFYLLRDSNYVAQKLQGFIAHRLQGQSVPNWIYNSVYFCKMKHRYDNNPSYYIQNFNMLTDANSRKILELGLYTLPEYARLRAEDTLSALIEQLVGKLDDNLQQQLIIDEDKHGKTLLDYAFENNLSKYSQSLLRLAAKNPKACQRVNSKQRNIFHTMMGDDICCWRWPRSFATESKGSDPPFSTALLMLDRDHYTPIHLALLKAKTNWEHKDGWELDFAKNAIKSCTSLLEKDQIVDDNRFRYTLTSLACRVDGVEVVKALPMAYVQQSAATRSLSSGKNAFHYAARGGNLSLVQAMLEKFPLPSKRERKEGEVAPTHNLIDIIFATDNRGWTVLHHAVEYGRPDMFDALLAQLQPREVAFKKLKPHLDSLEKIINRKSNSFEYKKKLSLHFGLHRTYDYLIYREAYWTRREDYEQRVRDFKQFLSDPQKGTPLQAFSQKIHLCFFGGSAQYFTHRSLLRDVFQTGAHQGEIESFKEFLQAETTSVARDLKPNDKGGPTTSTTSDLLETTTEGSAFHPHQSGPPRLDFTPSAPHQEGERESDQPGAPTQVQ